MSKPLTEELQQQIDLLKSPEAYLRIRAAAQLSRTPIRQAAPPLIHGLATDPDWSVRQAFATALEHFPGRRALHALERAARDREGRVRVAAVTALGRRGELDGLDTLIYSLKDHYLPVRQSAVRALGRIRHRRSVEILTAMLKDDRAPMRREALAALGTLQDPHAIPTLRWMYGVERAELRCSIIRTAGLIAERTTDEAHSLQRTWLCELFIKALGDEDATVRTAAIAAQKRLQNPDTLPALFATIEDDSAEVRHAAEDAFAEVDAPGETLELSLKALGCEEWRLRLGAARCLRRLADSRAAPALCAALGDDAPPVVKAAREALRTLDQWESCELLQIALASPVVRTRAGAAQRLGERDDPAAVERLLPLIDDEASQARAAAILALGKLGAVAVGPRLLSLVTSDDYRTRQAAIQALGLLRWTGALPVLQRRLLPLVGENFPYLRELIRTSIQAIQESPEGNANLPLVACPPATETTSLPTPSRVDHESGRVEAEQRSS